MSYTPKDYEDHLDLIYGNRPKTKTELESENKELRTHLEVLLGYIVTKQIPSVSELISLAEHIQKQDVIKHGR